MTQYNQLLNHSIICNCGRSHFVPIKDINFEFVPAHINNILKKYVSGNNILIVCDTHTHEIINKKIIEILESFNEYNLSIVEFEDKKLIPDERAVGRILMTTPRDLSGIISIGSGTINDLSRLIGDRLKIPVITIATAPSMDGYAASGSSLMLNGIKTTVKGSPVTSIYGDIDVIKNAPYDLIQSGFGDIIGKRTAIADWKLSQINNGEYWCDKTVDLVMKSTNLCIENAENIAKRDTLSIKHLIEALSLSGIAMSMVDDTRPASGGEHLFSHYMVMKSALKGEVLPSHGRTVAIGTLIVTHLYNFLFSNNTFDKLNNSCIIKEEVTKYLPKTLEVCTWLKIIGLSTDPRNYNIDKYYMDEIIRNSCTVRKRYTVFTLLKELNLLDEASAYISNIFY